MSWKRVLEVLLVVPLVAILASCDSAKSTSGKPDGSGKHPMLIGPRKVLVEVESLASLRVVQGQTIYVPAYPAIFTSDDARPFNLAVTLAFRNTDRKESVVVSSARLYDRDGKLVRDAVSKPLRIPPLASVEIFLQENDTTGGIAASFLIDWVSEQTVSPPIAEAVMVGIASSRGLSFTCEGHVISEHAAPEVPKN